MPGLTKEQKKRREALKQERLEQIKKHADELLARFKRGEKFEALYEELEVQRKDLKRQQEVLDQMQRELDDKQIIVWRKQEALMELEVSGAFKDESK
jgi:thioredoxin-like negative regulator of GroEL